MSKYTGEEIKKIIDSNNSLIETMIKPGQFVLNREISDLLRQNDLYRQECPHEFVDGYCRFCGFKEDK